MLVPRSVMVMTAPDTTAPEASVTWPLMLPVSLCAASCTAEKGAQREIKQIHGRNVRVMLHLKYFRFLNCDFCPAHMAVSIRDNNVPVPNFSALRGTGAIMFANQRSKFLVMC